MSRNMPLSEMQAWQLDSVRQALEALEPEIMCQWAGYVTYGGN